jgi:hypothetical protein
VRSGRRTLLVAAVAVLLGLSGALVYASTSSRPGAAGERIEAAAPAERAGDEVPGQEARAEGGNPEAQEQAESTQERLDAFHQAKQAGRFGAQAVTATPAAGWAGEQLFNAGTDDWEPAIAADPTSPWVYIVVTRYGVPKPCSGNCPAPYMVIERSSDGGRTWTDAVPLCACKGSGQFDPIVEVVPSTGDVYAAFMNGFNVVFTKSSDHGATWSDPVPVYGNVSWNDKPTLAVSDDGRDVYISFNGPQGGDPYVAQSHDAGATWTQRKLVDSRRYFFAFDSDVLPSGTIVFSESSLSYTGPGGSAEGTVEQHVFVSRDRGTTWRDVLVDTVPVGEACVADGCSSDFYLGHSAVSADVAGNLVLVYDGATTNLGPQRIWVRRSTDGGLTWSARSPISVDGEEATDPAVEQTGNGDVRAWYAQTTGNDTDVWNVYYRSSSNGGQTWSAAVKISDAVSGAEYKSGSGFLEPYGDYGEIAITSAGKTIAVWGEGFSWTGPGGVWFNRQT